MKTVTVNKARSTSFNHVDAHLIIINDDVPENTDDTLTFLKNQGRLLEETLYEALPGVTYYALKKAMEERA